MTRKKRPLPLLENIRITAFAAEGKSLARIDDKVLFVPYTVPGDVVDVAVVRRRRSYDEGRVVRMVTPSEHRIKPRCTYFGICGGCKWQMVPYEMQLQMKQQQVQEQLTHIGKLQLPPLNDIMGSEEVYAYRNKLEFGCANRTWVTSAQLAEWKKMEKGERSEERGDVRHPTDANAVGFHISGVFDKVLPIEECHLMHPLHNEIRNFIAHEAETLQMTFYDNREHKGQLRDIIIRNANSGEWMLIVQFCMDNEAEKTTAMTLLQRVQETFSQITSIIWVNNQKFNDTFNDLPVHVFYGKPAMSAHMEDLTFQVGPKSFYQTNTRQAYRLYDVVRRMAALTGSETVYDLYTGTGTIALFLARHAAKVIGVEYVSEAIEDAKRNAELNNIDNTLFYAGDMKDVLTADFIAQHGTPDTVVVDPPRAGMHPDVVQTLLAAAPKRIVYVSCNPATQARDVATMQDNYKIIEVQPVDMFPHTPHVENIILMEKQ